MAEKKNVFSKKIKDRADALYKTVISSGRRLKGHTPLAISAACLHMACKEEGEPRTCNEICDSSKDTKKVSRKELSRCIKTVCKVLDTSVDVTTSDDFMERFCTNLGLPKYIETAATKIAKDSVELDLVPGRSPVTIAAAAIYMASQASAVKKPRKEIAEVIGLAEVTIRQSYQLMLPRAEELFPEDFNFVTPVDLLPMT